MRNCFWKVLYIEVCDKSQLLRDKEVSRDPSLFAGDMCIVRFLYFGRKQSDRRIVEKIKRKREKNKETGIKPFYCFISIL